MKQPLGKNPYRPGVGMRPSFVAGRGAALQRFRAILKGAPELPANLRLTGLRGVGKTVLLGEYARAASEARWASAYLELGAQQATERGLVQALLAALARTRGELSRAQRIKKVFGSAARAAASIGVSYQNVKFTLEADEEAGVEELSRALFETVKLAVAENRAGFLLLLDEAQTLREERDARGEHPLSLLISAVAALQRAEAPLPLGLVACGLPTLSANLLRARSYTERMFRGEEVGRLTPAEAAEAFVEPLRSTPMTAEPALVERVTKEVEGYPYFVQLWGAELWDAAEAAERTVLDRKLLGLITPDIHRRLDLDFYEPRVATLTPAEQEILLGSAHCSYPPLRSADLAAHAGKSPGNVNVLLGRLVDAGVLYRLRKGEYEYTAPRFREYLARRARRG